MPHLVQKLCPRFVLALIASLLLVLAGGLPATAAETATISGKVTVPAGVDPNQVWVAAFTDTESWASSTGLAPDGSYELSGLAPGNCAGRLITNSSLMATTSRWASSTRRCA